MRGLGWGLAAAFAPWRCCVLGIWITFLPEVRGLGRPPDKLFDRLPGLALGPLVHETSRPEVGPLPDRPRKTSKERYSAFCPRFGVSHSRGDLTGFSPATCRVHRAARSCLRDWSSVARRKASGSRATLPAGFGAFALLDGPGSLSLGFRV